MAMLDAPFDHLFIYINRFPSALLLLRVEELSNTTSLEKLYLICTYTM